MGSRKLRKGRLQRKLKGLPIRPLNYKQHSLEYVQKSDEKAEIMSNSHEIIVGTNHAVSGIFYKFLVLSRGEMDRNICDICETDVRSMSWNYTLRIASKAKF